MDKLGKYREMLCRLVGGICILTDRDPYPIIQEFLDSASPEDAVHFAKQINVEHEEMAEDERVEHWDRWIESYWKKRQVGKPQQFKDGELAEMYEWGMTSPHIFTRASAMICESTPLPVGQRFFLHKLEESQLLTTNTHDVIKILKHLLTTEQQHYDCDSIARIVKKIVDDGKGADVTINDVLKEICQGLAVRQFSGAADLMTTVKNARGSEA